MNDRGYDVELSEARVALADLTFQRSGEMRGQATLLPTDDTSANWTFIRATEADGLANGDRLLGHTAVFRGVARRELKRIEFVVELDSPEGRQLTGVPFDMRIESGTKDTLALRLNPSEKSQGDQKKNELPNFRLRHCLNCPSRLNKPLLKPQTHP